MQTNGRQEAGWYLADGLPLTCTNTLAIFQPFLNIVRLPDVRVDTPSNKNTTLSGGSLGSCVDEERSQLRELM